MKIFFDQGTPVPLRHHLSGHEVGTAFERGWQNLQNGELLRAVEADGFDCFVTTDQSLKYQQNLSERNVAIVVLLSTSWPRIAARADEIAATIANVPAREYVEIPI